MFVLFPVNHAGPRPSIPARNLQAGEIRPNLEQLEALGPGNRARDRRETAFCAAKIAQQPARPGPRSSSSSPPAARCRTKSGARGSNLEQLEALSPVDRSPARRETALCLSNRDANPPAAARAARAARRRFDRRPFTKRSTRWCENLIKSHTGADISIDRSRPAAARAARRDPPAARRDPRAGIRQ